MRTVYRWIQNFSLQQASLLLISSILLLYSVLNLIVRARAISIGFVWLAAILFIVCLLNLRICRIQLSIEHDIRLIQKEYDAGLADRSSRMLSLNAMQKKLWQYIVSDYPVKELLHVFSFSLGRLAKEVHFLYELLGDGGPKSEVRSPKSEVLWPPSR